MQRLTRTFLQSDTPLPDGLTAGPPDPLPEKVLQFGTGNFLRGYIDWMIDELNGRGLFNGSVAVVQSTSRGRGNLLNEQNGLYTVLTRGVENGLIVDRRRIVTSISRSLAADYDWPAILEIVRRPELRLVCSNTTEAGIEYVKQPLRKSTAPSTFPARLAALLYDRYQTFGGDPDSGVIILPCELIENNGSVLREIVLQHAGDWHLEEGFLSWLDEAVPFLNTLVDRIVPGFPEEEAIELFGELGYEDKLLTAAEPYHLLVIEGPEHLKDEFPFHEAGLNVVWTADLAPYRTRKVRVLNGAHTSSVLAAFHAGLNTVGEMMADDLARRYLQQAVFNEIVPVLPMGRDETQAFAETVFERFSNPFIRHELLAISLNSVSKWKVRVLPTLRDYLDANETQPPVAPTLQPYPDADHSPPPTLPPVLTFSLAALIRFYEGKLDESEMTGTRDGEEYPIRDNPEYLEIFAYCWDDFHRDGCLDRLVERILSNATLWDEDLTLVPGLGEAVRGHLDTIMDNGMRNAMSALLEGLPR